MEQNRQEYLQLKILAGVRDVIERKLILGEWQPCASELEVAEISNFSLSQVQGCIPAFLHRGWIHFQQGEVDIPRGYVLNGAGRKALDEQGL